MSTGLKDLVFDDILFIFKYLAFRYTDSTVTVQHPRHSGCCASLVVVVQRRCAPCPPTKYEPKSVSEQVPCLIFTHISWVLNSYNCVYYKKIRTHQKCVPIVTQKPAFGYAWLSFTASRPQRKSTDASRPAWTAVPTPAQAPHPGPPTVRLKQIRGTDGFPAPAGGCAALHGSHPQPAAPV